MHCITFSQDVITTSQIQKTIEISQNMIKTIENYAINNGYDVKYVILGAILQLVDQGQNLPEWDEIPQGLRPALEGVE